MPPVSLYTDASSGSCAGRGGFAVVSPTEVLLLGSETGFTTVTRLEGLAVISAMRLAHTMFKGRKVHIHTDSSLWFQRYSNLIPLHHNGWRRKNGKLAKETDILNAMWDYYDERIKVFWVKAHSGNRGNAFADKMARTAKELALNINSVL